MSSNHVFRMCRACLSPGYIVTLSSLFDEDGKSAEKLKEVSGIDVSCDRDKNDALICEECSVKLESAYEFIDQIRKHEVNFFVEARMLQAMTMKNSQAGNDDDEEMTEAVADTAGKPTTASVMCIQVKTSGPKSSKRKTSNILAQHKQESQVVKPSSIQGERSGADAQQAENPKSSQVRELIITPVLPPSSNASDGPSEMQVETPSKLLVTKRTKRVTFKGLTLKKRSDASVKIQRDSLKDQRKDDVTKSTKTGFICEVDGCEKCFRTKQTLKLHQTVHSDARPFVCHCGSSYKHQTSLITHQKSHGKV